MANGGGNVGGDGGAIANPPAAGAVFLSAAWGRWGLGGDPC
jgi:hypothetical protein